MSALCPSGQPECIDARQRAVGKGIAQHRVWMSQSHGVPRLLLIERTGDGRTIRQVLDAAREILHVDHVSTVAQGVMYLKSQPVSAVLLDLTLPEARALTAVDELRRASPK